MVAAGGKDGLLHIVDRTTHKAVSKTPVTTVDAKAVTPTPQGSLSCPGVAGGVAWNGPAFDPRTQTIYIGALDFCTVMKAEVEESKYIQGGFYMGGTWAPGPTPASGWITAVDGNTGKVRWRYHTPAPALAAVTPTAGGVLFGGDNAGNFYVFDSADGKVLKQVATGGSLSGGMISYDVEGRQYVAFTSGNVSRTLYGALGHPTVRVYALKQLPDLAAARAAGPDVANGARLYVRSCTICHGADGKSVSGADLGTVKNRFKQADLEAWIKNPAPPMPKAFPEPLDDEDNLDIRDLAAYIEQWH